MFVRLDPPALNSSVFYYRKQGIRDGKETTQTVRDCTKLRQVDVLVWQCQSRIDAIRQVQQDKRIIVGASNGKGMDQLGVEAGA